MIHKHDVLHQARERAERACRNAGETRPAIRCAFWLGLHHAEQGEMAKSAD